MEGTDGTAASLFLFELAEWVVGKEGFFEVGTEGVEEGARCGDGNAVGELNAGDIGGVGISHQEVESNAFNGLYSRVINVIRKEFGVRGEGFSWKVWDEGGR